MSSCRPPSAIVAAALLAVWPAIGFAAGGYQFGLPLGPKNPSGLLLAIDGRGIDANGYRPIHIEIKTRGNKPLVADRQLRIVLEFSKFTGNSVARVSQIVELPEGATSVKTTFVVPQSSAWGALSVETYEGGEKLKDLSQEHFGWPSTNAWNWTEARPAFLFIDSRAPSRADREAAVASFRSTGNDPSPGYRLPDVRPLLNLFPDLNNTPGGTQQNAPVATAGTRISDTALLSIIDARSRIDMLAPAELPTRWIELSQYDVAVVSLPDLQLMASTHPAQLAALRDWVSTGPTLIVYGGGSNFARLADVEKLLELPSLAANSGSSELRGWTVSDKKKDDIGGLRAPFDESGAAFSSPIPYQVRNVAKPPRRPSTATTTVAPPDETRSTQAMTFVLRPAATGCVVVVEAEQPFPGSPRDWAWLCNSVSRASEGHWQWFRRWGCSLHRTNDDYWKFLIPGVGEAPVISFILLVSLFAVVMGPVNYFFLRRSRRLYLLLLTVPAGATLVTLGLFAFALASDGFSMRLRMRSFADLDQRTERAAVWSRQSYYAAMAPSQGLHFPEDTTVFPILHEPSARAAERTTLLVWDGDQQLRQGYLSSRTATQFMVCRATTTKAKLVVAEGAEVGQPPNVENHLAAGIRYLLLCDRHGDYFAGQSIAENRSQELTKIDVKAATDAMVKLGEAVKPAPPHGYDPKAYDDNMFLRWGPRFARMTTGDGGAGDPQMATSLLETNIDAALHPADNPLAPGSYIAIVETSPVVVSGVPRAREEASFHVVRGRY